MRVYKDKSLIHSSVQQLFADNRYQSAVLLDVSWHLHRGLHAFRNMTAGVGGRVTGHIYSFLSTIRMIEEKIPGCAIIFCKDGRPVRRQGLLESRGEIYKPGRAELEVNVFADYGMILASASCLGNVFEAFLPDQESDDLMSNLARQITEVSPSTFVYVYSGDDDLLQTIDDDHVCVLRKFDQGVPQRIDNCFLKMDDRMLEKYHGCDSYHLPYYRSICGDHSDVLPGIPRFNRDAAKEFALASESIDDLFRVEIKGQEKWRERLLASEKLVRFNYEVMNLRAEFTIPLKKYDPPLDKVVAVLDRYRLNSFKNFLRERL